MSNAVVPQRDSFVELVQQGAGVEWPAARVAAINKLLPRDFQNDPSSAIALAIRAKRSGLDPFTQIHAWKAEGGRLQFQTSRDGFIEIASRDPAVESLEFQHVYEGEDFSWRKDANGKVEIMHAGGLKQGRLLGAYCCAHMVGDAADHLEMRLVEDYRHLFNKQNWSQYLPDMLITRVISATVRLVCPSSAGLYSAADFALNEADTSVELIRHHAESVTEDQIHRIIDDLEAAQDEAEVQILSNVEKLKEMDEDYEEAEAEPDPTLESRYECVFCGDSFDSQQGLAGHGRKHSKERAALEWLTGFDYPFPADVMQDNGGWVVVDSDSGEVFAQATDIVLLQKAVKAWRDKETPTSTGTVTPAEGDVKVSDIYEFVRATEGVEAQDIKNIAEEVSGGNTNMFDFTPEQRQTVLIELRRRAAAHGGA